MTRKNLELGDVLHLLDGDESELEGLVSDDDDDEDDFIPQQLGGDDETSDSDDEPLAHFINQPAPSTSEQPTKKQLFKWRNKTFEPGDVTFSGSSHDAPLDGEVLSPYRYFQQFITVEMIDALTESSNIYSMQKKGVPSNISTKEMEQAIGMYLRMGIVKMPGNRTYWETENRYPPVADVMSRNKFQDILSSIHFANNLLVTDEEKKNKLWKVKPWLDRFRENCLKLTPDEHNSIDEMMVKFNGKFSGIKQYVRGKPHPWGFKIWARTSVSGLLYDFEVYQGSQRTFKSELGLCADVVLNLSATLPSHKNYKIIADNFFSGIKLVNKLHERGIQYLGTIRTNRIQGCSLKSEKEMKKQGRGSYEEKVEVNENICVVHWYDNKPVTVISSFVGANPTDIVRRWDKSSKSHVQIPRPFCVSQYNKFMGGVDLLDALSAKYKYGITSRRWYLYLFWHTISVAVVNAWLLYQKEFRALQKPEGDLMKLRMFQAQIATSLIMCKAPKRGRPSLDEVKLPKPALPKKARKAALPREVRCDGVGHWPIKVAKRGRCKYCADGFTGIACEKCELHLCFTSQKNCFRLYHI